MRSGHLPAASVGPVHRDATPPPHGRIPALTRMAAGTRSPLGAPMQWSLVARNRRAGLFLSQILPANPQPHAPCTRDSRKAPHPATHAWLGPSAAAPDAGAVHPTGSRNCREEKPRLALAATALPPEP